MKASRLLSWRNGRILLWLVPGCLILAGLLLYRLGSLTGGLSHGEAETATVVVGWHGMYHGPFYLPLKIVRSVVFFLAPHHGQTLTRLPNAIFGGLSIVAFAALIQLWHGRRIATLTTLLFACSAWTLHVSRLASFDVMYLWATVTLLLTHAALRRYADRRSVFYGSLLLWGIMLYIPGMVWLVLANAALQRQTLCEGWQHLSVWGYRSLAVLSFIIWLPLLIIDLQRPHQLLQWLGWPVHIAHAGHLPKQFAAVLVHLFVRGPQYPQLWLGRMPILSIFSLVAALLGIYFYLRHLKAQRSRLLVGYGVIGFILVGLGGAVPLSLLVPLLYIAAAAGLGYLLQRWLRVFPFNPLARGLGIGLLTLAVLVSCFYGLRAYFLAWPHHPVTHTIFRYHR